MPICNNCDIVALINWYISRSPWHLSVMPKALLWYFISASWYISTRWRSSDVSHWLQWAI